MEEMKERFRKSAVDLTDLATGLLVLGVVVGIGARILISMRDSRLSELGSIATNNETILASEVPVVLTNSGTAAYWGEGIVAITNASIGDPSFIEATGNYSSAISSGFGDMTVTFAGTSDFNGTQVNVSYISFNTSEAQWYLPDAAATGIGEYGNWFDIIVIVGIAGLILALILMSFGRRNEEAGISY